MISTIVGTENSYPSTSVTNYNHISTNLLGSWNATETARDEIVPAAFDLSELYVLLDAAPTAGKSWEFTVMKNGSATAITLTIADAAVSGTYAGSAVSFAAGDTISLRAIPTGTPTTGTNVWWNLKCSGTGFPVMGANTSNTSNSATQYTSPQAVSNTWNTSVAPREIVVPTAGTFSKLYIQLDGVAGGTNYVWTMYKNGSSTALTVTIGAGAATGSDTSNSFTVAAGDRIVLQCTPNGTPTSRNATWGMLFTPDVDGESWFGYGSNAAPSTTLVRYEQPIGLGGNSWNATERQLVIGAYDLTKIYAYYATAPGGSASWDLTARKNAADTALTVNVSGASQTGNATATASFAQGDKLSVELTPNSTPASPTDGVHFGLLMFVDPGGGDDHTILSDDTALALSMDNATLTQNHVVAGQDTALALSMDNATITQNHVIQPQDISLGLSEDNTTVAETNFSLVAQDVALSLTEDETTLTQLHIIAAQDIALGLSEDNATITQDHIVVAEDIALALSEDNTTVDHNHVLSAQDIALGLTEDNTTVEVETVVLSTTDIALGLTTDNTTISQNHVVEAQDVALALTEDNTTISQNHVIATADIALGLTEDNTTVGNTNHFLATQDVALALTEDNTVLTQNHVIPVEDVALALTMDNAAITQVHILVPTDVALALSEDNATIDQTNFVLTVQDIALTLTEDNGVITQNHVVTVQDVALALTMSSPLVFEGEPERSASVIFLLDGRIAVRVSNNVYLPL